MIKEFVPHTLEQHKLFEWLAADVANFFAGNEPGARINRHLHEYARDLLKKEYIQFREYKPNNKPIEAHMALIDKLYELTEEERVDLKLSYIRSIQDAFAIKFNSLSTSQALMSKEEMSDFLNFIISKMKEEGIAFRKEIATMLSEEDYQSWVWFCLKHKACEVCHRPGDLHHVDHVGSFGRKNDDGRGKRVTCLCREHHSEIHSDHRAYNKYKIKGIYLNDNQIKILKVKYPAQFKAFKEDTNDERGGMQEGKEVQ